MSSRSIPLRREYQKGLESTLSAVNARSSAAIASPYTITLGDEFQALYTNVSSLFEDLFTIVAWSEPFKIRFALAYDTISTDINPNQSTGMDGPAFAEARDLLNELKKEARAAIQIAAPSTDTVRLVNLVLKSVCHLTELWHPNAIHVLSRLILGQKPDQIARDLSLSVGTTYKHIREKYLHDYVSTLETITAQLSGEFQE